MPDDEVSVTIRADVSGPPPVLLSREEFPDGRVREVWWAPEAAETPAADPVGDHPTPAPIDPPWLTEPGDGVVLAEVTGLGVITHRDPFDPWPPPAA